MKNFSYFFKTAKNVLRGASQNGCNLRLRKPIHYNEGQELKVCLPQCLKLLVDRRIIDFFDPAVP
ncbi:hypothetical protein IB211_01285c [Intestinimonas butyriciproducens]|uniref:Uncharacterized protein n=1 Tax=Intestinimonas butyriciproducens TaxID=1297617 RepID=A0A0S2W2V6_9FIRM|nr:hypothetical protein IB211_01285c [Intestinimonas butyriciproducens]